MNLTKSYTTPTDEQVDSAMSELSSPELDSYFFDRLQNPDWISPLAKRDVFQSPPVTEHVPGGGARFPIWPRSKYLARMAPLAATEVAEILSCLETDNPSVLCDVIDAALGMPAQLATRLVPEICRAARDDTLWIYFRNASILCAKLADNDEAEAALTLADALFDHPPDRSKKGHNNRDVRWYKDGLKNAVPALAKNHPHEFLPRLCAWLVAIIESRSDANVESGEDSSCYWRPAVEEHAQNSEYQLASTMVGFTREGFEVAIRAGQLTLPDASAMLNRYAFLIFKRLELHLIREFATQNEELARETLLNRNLFDDYRFKHEYAMLAGGMFRLLAPEDKEVWYGWIDRGPDLDQMSESMQIRLGRDATEEERQRRNDYWKFEKLHWVRGNLERGRRRFYERMLAEHGEPELSDLNVRMRTGWGVESPMTVDELSKMSFEQAVENVSQWRPETEDFMAPEIEGLGSTFEKYIATDPQGFSAFAMTMVDRPAIYVRGFIDKMADAVRQKAEIDIEAVLKLCDWVVTRPIEERALPESAREGMVDKNWQWTREAISRLIKSICSATSDDGPRHEPSRLRKEIWRLLEQLCQDSADSHLVCEQGHEDPRARDYVHAAINSARGKAIDAALEYAHWIANDVKILEEGKEIVSGGFDEMSEVRDMLKWQISAPNRSVEALAMIGDRFDLIYWIDRNWLEKNVDAVFRLDGIERTPPEADGWAAWNAFLVWNAPHIRYYNILRSQFAFAVEQAATVSAPQNDDDGPMYRLGEHLMVLYGRGHLDLDDDGLLGSFLETGVPSIRRHAIGFAGRTLEGDQTVPESVLQRFHTLWEVYWAGNGQADAKASPESYLFGTWFSAGKFPDEWALAQLEQFMKVVPVPDPDFSIVEQLARIAERHPKRSVRALRWMVRGDPEGWRVHGYKESAMQILRLALNADPEARLTATETIDVLGRRGYLEFGELLAR